MENSNLNQVCCAKYLRAAMRIVGKSAREIVTLLSNGKTEATGDILEISFKDTTLCGSFNENGILEKAYLFPDDDFQIFKYFEYLDRNFEYSFAIDAWVFDQFYIRIHIKNEWCISVESFVAKL